MGAAATFAEALAGSVLVRGVLYANAHPAPRQWLPLRKSGWAAAQRGAAANAAQLQSLVWAGGGAALHWCAWLLVPCDATAVCQQETDEINNKSLGLAACPPCILFHNAHAFLWNCTCSLALDLYHATNYLSDQS